MRREWATGATAVLVAVAAIWVGNASPLGARPDGAFRLVAHRGVHQTFSPRGIDGNTCTASRIRPVRHGYIENTLPSMRAAFDAGADAVELDVHRTRDGHLVVFHDHMLECRTEASGAPEQHTLAELRELDLGHGYTADDGETYPLRGTGYGLWVTLPEVFAAFPDRRFVIDIKSGAAADGERVVEVLQSQPIEAQRRQIVYGGQAAEVVRAALPEVRTFTKARIKRCLKGYVALGWLGVVPAACHDTWVAVPMNYAPYLWGFPRRFEARMARVGSEVVLAGPLVDGISTGVDTATDRANIPPDFTGWVWTNRVERFDEADDGISR